MDGRRYRFGPHPHGGWLLGLRGSQVVGAVIAGVFAILLLRVGGPSFRGWTRGRNAITRD
jgi:hypothetical protein